METFLDIIIPEYDCPKEYMIRLLNSINRQKNVDFSEIGILIINDFSKNKYKNNWFKQRFPKLNIQYYLKKVNEGQGMTRQYGIENSKGEYITFIDQDDELYGDTNLATAISFLKERKPNFAISSIYEEVLYEKKYYFKEHSCYNFKSLHGLFMNRIFLLEKGISFHPDLRQFEDVYFNSCLFYSNSTFDYFDFYTYIWKYNPQSQVRSDSKYSFEVKNFDYYLKCTEYSIEFLIKCNSIVLSQFTFVSLYGCLMILYSEYFNYPELESNRNSYIEKLRNLYLKYKTIIDDLTFEERNKLKKDEFDTLSRSMPKLVQLDIEKTILL